MRIWFIFLTFFLIILCVGCPNNQEAFVFSPSKNIKVNFHLTKEGKPYYLVSNAAEIVIDTSFLGFDFKNSKPFNGDFKFVKTTFSEFNETWQMPWGEQLNVVNHYNELKV
ncbi:MAG: alpha-glucosidase, partial [Flavobacteriaceae bacterium CG_4_8_14_3_um_filter_31_8]